MYKVSERGGENDLESEGEMREGVEKILGRAQKRERERRVCVCVRARPTKNAHTCHCTHMQVF